MTRMGSVLDLALWRKNINLLFYNYFRLNVYFLQQTILFMQKENAMTQRSYDTDVYAYLLIRVGGEISRYYVIYRTLPWRQYLIEL